MGLRTAERRFLLFAGFVIGLASIAPPCRADGITLDGVSAASIGRGGANVGFADNASMLHDNPGAMGQMRAGAMLQFGATSLFTQFDYGDDDNAQGRSQNQLYALPEVAYIRQYNDQWTFGVGIYTPTGFGSVYNLEGPAPFSGSQRYESFGSLSKILLGASYTPEGHEYLSIGGTLGPAVSFVNLEGPYTLQGPTAPSLPSILDLGVDGAGLTWSVGLSCQLSESTSVGVAYLADVKIDAEGEVGLISPLGTTLYDASTDVTWPRSVAAGIKHQVSCRTVVGLDLSWTDWSAAFDQLDIRLSSPTNSSYPATAVETFPLNWRDTFTTRVGVEHTLENGHIVRAGYVHHRSPIPAGTITPWIPGALENAFSLGYGLDISGWQANLAYMFSFGPEVEVGSSDFLGGDFDNSIHRNKSHAIAFALTRTFSPSGCKRCR